MLLVSGALFLILAGAHAPTPTYRSDIAPILAAKCVGCHSPEGSGPFSLRTYAEVRNRAELIRTVALLQKMPPTIVDSDFGPVSRFAKLTPLEIVALQDWLRAGLPEGQGVAASLPEAPEWPLGKPDQIVENPAPILVPSEGAFVYRTMVVELPIDQSAELVAFDIRPRSPKVMRQAVLALDGPGGDPFPPTGMAAERLIGAWATGSSPWRLPDNASIRLEAKQKLRIRLQYHPSGKSEDGGLQIGLYFSPKARAHRPYWKTIGLREFELPGTYQTFSELVASTRLDDAARIVCALPEARSLATAIFVTARQGQEWNRNLLLLWRWDRRWQGAYNFAELPLLTKGTEIEAKAQYDNSAHGVPGLTLDQIKRLPPNPTVTFGPKETDELFWVHVQMAPYP